MKAVLEKFKVNAESTTATVEIINNNSDEISNSILNQIKSEKKVLVSIKNSFLRNSLPNDCNYIFTPTKDEIGTVAFCITDSACGIAETGSVVISHESDYSAYFSMLTNNHIVLLNEKDIYEKPRDVFNDQGLINEGRKNFSIITGPSATADMGSLVRGVHGPEKLHIIIISENNE